MRHRRRAAAVLGTLVGAWLVSAPAAAQVPRVEVDETHTILPGQHVLIRIDPVAGTAAFEDPSRRPASADQLAAVAAVPAWLAADLAAAFYRMGPTDHPDEFARMILDAEDPAYVDELGFLIAHLSPEDLHDMDRAILPEIVRRIYEYDAEIRFAELVEHGEATDPERYTSVAYRVLRDGTPDSYELPRDLYYWNVVHPALDGDNIVYIDPSRHWAVDPPAGWHWRSYLWTDDPERSYQAADVLVSPDRMTAAAFADWSLGGPPRAFSHFENLEVGPIELVRADTGEPVAISFTRGDGGCGNNDRPNPDGMYFATLSPVELAAAGGSGSFLNNLVRAGGGNATLLPSDITVWDPLTLEPRRILIVRDRLPFDLAVDPTETAASMFGRGPDVIGSAELDALVLSTDAAPFLNTTYNKIIVPSDQPRALYEALVRNTEKLERFVDDGGTIELHGATRPEDDWSDLRLPGGIHCAPQDGSATHDTLVPYGYPLLSDVVPQAEYLWDFVPQMGLPGDRHYDPAGTALERLGWWVSQTVTWNIQEKVCWKRGDVPRYLLPHEIAYDHFGNCGELQDMWTGGGRSLLIGIWNVGTLADDHMWNEFWQGEQWLPLQVDWSDNDTRIGNWGVAYDADTGGGKTIAAMDGFRGDGLMVPALGRFAPTELDGHLWNDYSQHVTLVATVEDVDGNPVDGAQVMIATPSLYNPEALTIATWQATGPDGVARIVVGEGNDYYVQITSPIGSYPDPDHVDSWVAAADALPDAEFAMTFPLEGRLAPPEGAVSPPAGSVTGRIVTDISVEREILHGTNLVNGRTWADPRDSGDVQALLMPQSQWASYAAGGDFTTIAAAVRGRDLTLEQELRGDEWLVLVVANQARAATEEEVVIHFELWDPAAEDGGGDGTDEAGDATTEDGIDTTEDGIDTTNDGSDDVTGETGPIDADAGGGGCGCATFGATPGTAGWLAALALLSALRRRRRTRAAP